MDGEFHAVHRPGAVTHRRYAHHHVVRSKAEIGNMSVKAEVLRVIAVQNPLGFRFGAAGEENNPQIVGVHRNGIKRLAQSGIVFMQRQIETAPDDKGVLHRHAPGHRRVIEALEQARHDQRARGSCPEAYSTSASRNCGSSGT